MSADNTRFRKIKIDELKKILPEEAMSGNNNHKQAQKKTEKDRAGPLAHRTGNSP